MSEIGHSLPPEIKGKAHGTLHVKIGNFVWLDPSLTPANLNFRLKFWGEKGPGVILKPQTTDSASNEVEYVIRCTQPIFINYLMDMGCLVLDVTDQTWRLLGSIKINVKLYLKKDPFAAKGNFASNFGFSNIDVQGTFPILFPDNPPKKIGDIDLEVLSQFGEVTGKVSKANEANLPVKPNFNEKYSENAVIHDGRIANSLLPQGNVGEYDAKRVAFKEEKEKNKSKEMVEAEKPSAVFKRVEKASEGAKIEFKTETNITLELENLKAKGERLRKRLEASSKPDVLQELMPKAMEEKYNPLPTLSELQALTFPHDPTEVLKNPVQDKPFSELSMITHLKLSISSLVLTVSRKDINPYIDCLIPLPGLEGNRNDSFKISHKGLIEDIFQFNHESLHHVIVGDGVFSKLASSSIRFKLCGNEKGKLVDLGKAEIKWEKILLSQGFSFTGELEVTQEETKAKRPMQKTIGLISVNLSLINDKQVVTKPLETVKKTDPKSFLLYLYLDHVSKLAISPVSLYLTYKTFPEPERITTEIYWNYQDGSPISHKMVTAVLVTDVIAAKLSTSFLIIELWNKLSINQEDLIGIVKLPLQLFASYISSGESLANSVYPIIAFDEYRPITNVKTGEEIGYLKVCLAMGSPAQVNRLRQTHEVQVKIVKNEAKMQPEHDIEEFEEKSPYTSQYKEIVEPDEIVSQSIESIGDIAAFLNQRNKETKEEKNSPLQSPQKELKSPEKITFPQEPEFVPIDPVKIQKSPKEIITSLNTCLETEKISLEEELKIADRFNYGYMHRESLSYFFQELRLGFTATEIALFIDYILENRPSSTARRVLFIDILSILGLIQPLFTRHTFTVSIIQVSACSVMSRLANSQVYLKYQFPTESTYVESDLLDPSPNITVGLKSSHSCTFPKASALSECFSDQSEGISVFLCRNGQRGEEKVIGKGLLPIEEVIELETSKKLNRVICLYGDANEELQIYRSDLIGKVKVSIEYASDFSYQAVDSSGELLFEKHTQVERKIPRNSSLNILLDSYSELNRGIKYMKSIGTELSSRNCVSIFLSVFYEDSELLSKYSEIMLAKTSVSNTQSINSAKIIDLNLSQSALEYFQHHSGLLSMYFDNELLGTCKVPLVQLLLHSILKGEYAILNEYGQFMGLVNLTLSFSNDNFQIAPSAKPKVEAPNTPKALFHITIESAMNLKSEIDGEHPNFLVEFIWTDGKTYSTNAILRSSCPCWNKSFTLGMPTDKKLLEKPIIFTLIHKSTRGLLKVGEALIDLAMILNVKNIDGWYHFISAGTQIGQVKIKINCDADVHLQFTGKVKEEVFNRLPSPQIIEKVVKNTVKVENKFEERLKKYGETLENAHDDDIIARHYENMKSIENLARNFEMRMSGSGRNSSPLRKSRETSPYRRFIPTEYLEKSLPSNAHPLRKSREVSPPKYFTSESYEHIREKSPAHGELFESHYDLKRNHDFSPVHLSPERNSMIEKEKYYSDEFLHQAVKEVPSRPFEINHWEKPNYEYKEELPQHEDNEDDWDQERIADMLKTIEEASKFGEEPVQSHFEKYSGPNEYIEKKNSLTLEKSLDSEENLTASFKRKSSPYEPVYARASPKISRSELPKSLLSDPEISRIAAIMKGQSK